MKRIKSISGVTLLEVMLVLAVAAMIIVMSIRYYQSASSSQQANTAAQEVQAIVSVANNLAQASGSYQTANVNTANLIPLLPNVPNSGGNLQSPWNGTVSVSATSASVITIVFNAVPAAVCGLFTAKFQGNANFTPAPTTCNATGATNVTVTYTSQPS